MNPFAAHSTLLQRRRFVLLAASAVGTGRGAFAMAGDARTALQAAVDAAHRAGNRSRDAARHPVETLAFFGIDPAMTVVELAPGNGWYTEILAPLLRERGRLIAAHDPVDAAPSPLRSHYEAMLAASPALYGRVVVATLPRGPALADALAPRASVDAVLTFRSVHSWLANGWLDGVLQASHRLLRRGGVLGVVDHRAAPGTPIDRMRSSGYVTESLMAERAAAAGFALDATSEVNANPRDTRDHPHGVWSLPPVLRGDAAEQQRHRAIGESDRFTHRYVKA